MNIIIDVRGPLYVVIDGFKVVGRYMTYKEAEVAANEVDSTPEKQENVVSNSYCS